MNTKYKVKSKGYRIGAVSRLTGLTADNLRIWERRYQAVSPNRTPSGDRYYSPGDVSRLKLMKQLVDAGDSISAIASLSATELQDRLSASREPVAPASNVPARVVLIGDSLAMSMAAASDQLTDINVVNTFGNVTAFLSQANKIDADVLVVEQPTLHTDTATQIIEWLNSINAQTAIVIYRFAAKGALDSLPVNRSIVMRAPVDPLRIQNHCVPRTPGMHETADHEWLPDVVPPRKYNDEVLIKIASASTAVKCECPRHLTELISSLSAFETYSNECENRNARDAALHSYLNDATARARFIIESALSEVIEIDNIKY
jgi:DNA-binding transcriptional MerR regulator